MASRQLRKEDGKILKKSSLFQIVGLALPPIPREIARTPLSPEKEAVDDTKDDAE